MKYSVSVNKEKCIGDAICTALCSNWYMDANGKAQFRKKIISDEEYAENKEAEDSCPIGIIKIMMLE